MECCHRAKRSLPYGHFLTKVFKDAEIDLSSERDIELPSMYNPYNDKSLDWMGFEKSNGVWVRKRDQGAPRAAPVPPPPAMKEEDEIRDMEGGIDPQDVLDIPPLQTAALTQGETEIPHSKPIQTEIPHFEPSFFEAPQADIHTLQPLSINHLGWSSLLKFRHSPYGWIT